MNTCVPIKTNKRMGEGQERDVCCSLAVGWLWAPWTWHEGASSSLADALCLLLAVMRKDSVLHFLWTKGKTISVLLIPCISLQWRYLTQWACLNKSIFLLLGPSNYLFSKCFWKLSTTLHFRQSNYCLQFKVKIYCILLPITSPGPFLPV